MAGFEDMMGGQQAPQQAPAGGMDQGPAKPSMAGSAQELNISPQQEAEISKFVTMGTEVLISDQFLPKAAKIVETVTPVEEAMAQIGNAIASRIYFEASKEQDIDIGTVIVGGALLMQQIGEFAQQAGAELGPESIEDAFYRAADLFRDTLQTRGKLNPDELAQSYEQMRQEYGDDTFEMIGERMDRMEQARAPQMPQRQQQPQGGMA